MPNPRKNPDRVQTNAERQRAFRQRQAEARRAALLSGAPAPPPIATMPGSARWTAIVGQARTALETVLQEMEAYFDDRSEEWQESDRGQALQQRMDALQELVGGLEELQSV